MTVDAADGILADDTDADGDPLTANLVAGPSHGTLWWLGPDGDFMYYPDEQFVGTDSFTYQANDGAVNSWTTTVMIDVTNAAPDAVADSYVMATCRSLATAR